MRGGGDRACGKKREREEKGEIEREKGKKGLQETKGDVKEENRKGKKKRENEGEIDR